jgi:hypothetical protein
MNPCSNGARHESHSEPALPTNHSLGAGPVRSIWSTSSIASDPTAPSHFCKQNDLSLPLEHFNLAGHITRAVGCSGVFPPITLPRHGCPTHARSSAARNQLSPAG